MLLYSAGTDIELGSDLLVAATLHQEIKDLVVPWCYFDLAQINHYVVPPLRFWPFDPPALVARPSPKLRPFVLTC
jgi:hypothetical protein